MEFGSSIISIINLLFIPLVALHYHCKRRKTEFSFSPYCIYMYALISALNLLAADCVVSLLEKFFASTYQITTGGQLGASLPMITLFTQLAQRTFSCPVHSIAYTAVALVSSILLVLFLELFSKTVSLEVSIERKKKAGKKQVKDSEEITSDEN